MSTRQVSLDAQVSYAELLKIGRKAHRELDYVSALAAFNQAFELAKARPDADLLALLDQRSRVQLKLGKLDLARKDATSMIRRNKADGRGYLRCGYLEFTQEDYASALKWYEHGLNNVPTDDRLHKYLEVQKEKTSNRASKRVVTLKPKDPFKTLPAELAQYIVSYLEYKDVMKALQVSRDWSKTLMKMRPLLDTVDFRGCHKVITFPIMKASLKRLSRNPKSLHMSNMGESALNLLRSNLDRWVNSSRLEHLSITTKMPGVESLTFAKLNLRSLILQKQAITQGSYVDKILSSCRSLEILRIGNVTGSPIGNSAGPELFPFRENLRILDLRGAAAEGAFPSGFLNSTLLSNFPSLEEFQCHGMVLSYDTIDLSSLVHLRKLIFTKVALPCWPTLPQSLQIWENHACLIRNMQPRPIGKLTDLRVFSFVNIDQPLLMSSFLPQGIALPLSHINTEGSTVFADFPAFAAAGHLHKLEDLRLGGYQGGLDPAISVLEQLRGLEVLHLSQSTITGARLAEILRTPACQLRRIQLKDCEKVSPDVIQWAKAKNITIDIRKSEWSRPSGRRLRVFD